MSENITQEPMKSLKVTDEGQLVQASQYRDKYTDAHEAGLKLIQVQAQPLLQIITSCILGLMSFTEVIRKNGKLAE